MLNVGGLARGYLKEKGGKRKERGRKLVGDLVESADLRLSIRRVTGSMNLDLGNANTTSQT